MEQEIPESLQAYDSDQRSVLDQIEAGWSCQTRRPTAAEIDAWISAGRS
jgi:hypothetical protein